MIYGAVGVIKQRCDITALTLSPLLPLNSGLNGLQINAI